MPDPTRPETFLFVLADGACPSALAGALDCLRLANERAGRPLYAWRTATADGGPAQLAGGLRVAPDAALRDDPAADVFVLCTGRRSGDAPALAVAARRAERRGGTLGALGSGARLLADWGLLSGRRCALPWPEIPAFAEAHPDVDVRPSLYEIDGRRFTCAGADAAVDLFLQLIALRQGRALAGEVADRMLRERIREPGAPQRAPAPVRLGVREPKLVTAIEIMERELEDPLPRAELARRCNLSIRQLERLFRQHLGRSPARHYLKLRLERARTLLEQSGMSVLEIALVCGFASASHFTKCYRDHYGTTPRTYRAPRAAA